MSRGWWRSPLVPDEVSAVVLSGAALIGVVGGMIAGEMFPDVSGWILGIGAAAAVGYIVGPRVRLARPGSLEPRGLPQSSRGLRCYR